MYSIIFENAAADFLRKLDKSKREQIAVKIEKLKEDPKIGKPLTGPLIGLRSLRIGDYRAIYQILDKQLIILVVKLGHRKNV